MKSLLLASDLFCDFLKQRGVDSVFALPGTQNVDLFESFRNSKLKVVVPTDERNGGFMAIGHSRVSGQVGCLVVIPGPGFTNTLTAIAEAQHDSVPLVVIDIRKELKESPRFGLQVIDEVAIVKPLVKEAMHVHAVQDLSKTLKAAFDLAASGEPGPVFVSIHPQVFKQTVSGERVEELSKPLSAKSPISRDFVAALDRLRAARHPVFYIGQGCVASAKLLRVLVEKIQVPLVSTCSGRGILPDGHRMNCVYDFSCTAGENIRQFFQQSDCIFVLGAKLGHNGSSGFSLPLAPEKLVRVDLSQNVLQAAAYPAALAIQADVKDFVEFLLIQDISPRWQRDQIDQWKLRLRQEFQAAVGIQPLFAGQPAQIFYSQLNQQMPAQKIIVTDSGQHQVLSRAFLEIDQPNGLIVPSDFQSMGFGIPAAIGAALASRGARVVAITGDGGFRMVAMELLTAVAQKIPLTVIVFNDGYYGLIRHQQLRSSGFDFGVGLNNPDFSLFAKACGLHYYCWKPEDPDVLKRALSDSGVVLVEVLLTDPPEVEQQRVKSLRRARLRKMLGPQILNRVKKVLRR